MSALVLSVAEVAEALDCAASTLRKAIRAEHDANKPDSLRFCPGGRVDGTKYYVNRAIFETVMAGKAIDAHLRGPIPLPTAALDEAA